MAQLPIFTIDTTQGALQGGTSYAFDFTNEKAYVVNDDTGQWSYAGGAPTVSLTGVDTSTFDTAQPISMINEPAPMPGEGEGDGDGGDDTVPLWTLTSTGDGVAQTGLYALEANLDEGGQVVSFSAYYVDVDGSNYNFSQTADLKTFPPDIMAALGAPTIEVAAPTNGDGGGDGGDGTLEGPTGDMVEIYALTADDKFDVDGTPITPGNYVVTQSSSGSKYLTEVTGNAVDGFNLSPSGPKHKVEDAVIDVLVDSGNKIEMPIEASPVYHFTTSQASALGLPTGMSKVVFEFQHDNGGNLTVTAKSVADDPKYSNETWHVVDADGPTAELSGDSTHTDGQGTTHQLIALDETSGLVTTAGDYFIAPMGDGNYLQRVESGANVDAPIKLEMVGGQVAKTQHVDNGGGDPVDSAYDAPIVEIVQVGKEEIADQPLLGGRYGSIETFGIRIKDDGDPDTDTTYDINNLNLTISWAGDDYTYWGRYEAGTKTSEQAGVPTDDDNDIITKNFDDDTLIGVNELDFGFIADGGIEYAEGDFIASFMLQRNSTQDESVITLETKQYNLVEDYDDGLPMPRRPEVQDKTFTYTEDTVSVQMANERGVEAPNLSLFVSSNTVTDGLSLVPIGQMGNFVKYGVMLNVSVPSFITGATVASAQAISIDVDNIFAQSVVDLTGIPVEDDPETGEWFEAVGSVSSTFGSGTAALPTSLIPTVTGETYTGDEFVYLAEKALDKDDADYATLNDAGFLNTVDELLLEFDGLGTPVVETDVDPGEMEGKYLLAEFIAHVDTAATGVPISFKYGTGDGVGGYNWSSAIDIKMHKDSEKDAINFHKANGGDEDAFWDVKVSDGSDVALVGDRYYSNPGNRMDAVGAEDALAALKIAREAAIDAADSGFTQAQILAADFNQSGTVSAADAYDILQYSVHGSGVYSPEWIYVENVEDGESITTNVRYDPFIDHAVTQNTSISGTAILLGDVSASYGTLTNAPADVLPKLLEDAIGISDGGDGGDDDGDGGDTPNRVEVVADPANMYTASDVEEYFRLTDGEIDTISFMLTDSNVVYDTVTGAVTKYPDLVMNFEPDDTIEVTVATGMAIVVDVDNLKTSETTWDTIDDVDTSDMFKDTGGDNKIAVHVMSISKDTDEAGQIGYFDSNDNGGFDGGDFVVEFTGTPLGSDGQSMDVSNIMFVVETLF